MLRLKPANYASTAELAWGDAASQPFAKELLGASSKTVNWPAALFWVVAIGGIIIIIV